MATKNNIRRDYLIIKRILRGDFPSRETIMKALDTAITMRTFQRDIQDIQSNFDITIEYSPQKNGYSIDPDSCPDFDKLLYFLEVAESADMVLRNLIDKRRAFKYLSLSPSTQPKGTEQIKPLLAAIQQCKAVAFRHKKYGTEQTTDQSAHPYLLKEFEGRWYLFAYIEALGAFRTFGLDRISELTITETTFKREQRLADTTQKFEQVYGLVYEPDQNPNAPVERVVLHTTDWVAQHLQALPLHPSQEVEGNEVSIRVIINPEIENKILSYGENVEVLQPDHLRQKIRHRLEKNLSRYR